MLVHEHLIIRAEVLQPPQDVEYIEQWLGTLVEGLGMKIMMGPFAAYSEMVGNRGLTAACIIETSHIVMHAWDEENPGIIQLDVYSCAPVNREFVLSMLDEFEPIHVDYKFLDRGTQFIRML